MERHFLPAASRIDDDSAIEAVKARHRRRHAPPVVDPAWTTTTTTTPLPESSSLPPPPDSDTHWLHHPRRRTHNTLLGGGDDSDSSVSFDPEAWKTGAAGTGRPRRLTEMQPTSSPLRVHSDSAADTGNDSEAWGEARTAAPPRSPRRGLRGLWKTRGAASQLLSRAAVHSAFARESVGGEEEDDSLGITSLPSTDVEFASSADEGVQMPSSPVTVPFADTTPFNGRGERTSSSAPTTHGMFPLPPSLSRRTTRLNCRASRRRSSSSPHATSDLGVERFNSVAKPRVRGRNRRRRSRGGGSDDEGTASEEFLQALENLRVMASFGKTTSCIGSATVVGTLTKVGDEGLLSVGAERRISLSSGGDRPRDASIPTSPLNSTAGDDELSTSGVAASDAENGHCKKASSGGGWWDWVSGRVTLSGWQIIGLASLVLGLGIGAGSLLARKRSIAHSFTPTLRW